ncbi:MAG: DUF2852 domain-containing protein [Hyphomicrobiaceae bacterium]
MDIVQRMDDYGLPAWIAVMVVSFILFWPVGLGILAYLIWSGRMGSWNCGGRHRTRGKSRGRWHKTTGNTAFDEYRDETLKRLEDEQREFTGFLDQLRAAKDKAEFDQFMDDRRRRAQAERDERNTRDNDNDGPVGSPSPAY